MIHLLLAALSIQVSVPQVSPPARAGEALVPAVVEHLGDCALRDRLVRTMEVWHDAGDFLVGAAEPRMIEALESLGIRAHPLPEVQPDDELFVTDLASPQVSAALGRAVRLVFARGEQGLVAVPAGTAPRPSGFEPGRVCHAGSVAVQRLAWRPPSQPRALDDALLAAKAATSDPRIAALVAAASVSGLQANVQMLSSNYSRNSGVANYIDAARDQIVGRLQSLGYAPKIVPFSSAHGDNIRLDLPGSSLADEWVVIGAHYDSLNLSGWSAPAPGADDNASGSAAVLEIARVLAGAGDFERSLRLMWFAGEEYGLLGSKAAAQASVAAGEQIVGMFNLDMNAYRHPDDTRNVDFVINSTSAALNSLCDTLGAQYVPGWASRQGSLLGGNSDHSSYTMAGYPSTFPFEDLKRHSPYIHTAGDTFQQSTTDYELALMITRGVLAGAAVLADPIDLRIDHAPLPDTTNATGPYPVSAKVTSLIGTAVSSVTLFFSSDGLSFTPLPMVPNGADWVAGIPGQGSPKTIYYYITAVDDQGYAETLPRGAELGREPFSFFVGIEHVLYATGFEGGGDAGWTHGSSLGEDDWERGPPQGKAGDPAAAFEGSRVWGNDVSLKGKNGAYPYGAQSWLRSPTFNCSQATNVTLSFRRWLAIEAGPFDRAELRVNGQLVWHSPNGVDLIDTGWVPISIDISPLAAGNPSVQVEFRLSCNEAISYGGWNLDEFELAERNPGMGGCLPPLSYCEAKFNSMGCTPAIVSSGTPSVTSSAPFAIGAVLVINNTVGLLFYGSEPAFTPFQGGMLCVKAPFQRTSLVPSGGNPPPQDCSGVFSYDFNSLIQSGADPTLVQGASVYCQFWYRDPGDLLGFGTGLSDGLAFTICP